MKPLLRIKKCEFCGLHPCVCGEMDPGEDKTLKAIAWVVDFSGKIIGRNRDFAYDENGNLRYTKR